jgi:hypothetical protein
LAGLTADELVEPIVTKTSTISSASSVSATSATAALGVAVPFAVSDLQIRRYP